MGKKVILLSKYDFAGSGYKIAEAINLNSNNFVLPIVTHTIKYPEGTKRLPSLFKPDTKLGIKGWFEDISRIQTLINDADIIHFKGDSVPISDFIDNVKIPENKTRIVTVGGSYFRRNNIKGIKPIADIEEYVKRTNYRSAITPDLLYPEYCGEFTPHAYPTHDFINMWKNKKIPTISHSPSDRITKGTDIIIKASEILKNEGIDHRLDIIENVSIQESLNRKAKSTIFIGQIDQTVGWYGNSSIEAMAMGIPTLSYISEELKQKYCKDIKVVNCGKTAEFVANTIKNILRSDLSKLSKETYKWVNDFHGYETIGKMWDSIYTNIKC